MKVVIPYKEFNGPELKYTLRGIEKYIENPEVVIIGDLPKWVKNVDHIPFKDKPELQWKEQNIFKKLLLTDFDFLFFNDDHFLLEPFSADTYHFTGMLSQTIYGHSFKYTIQNTIDSFGDIPSYFRHAPVFVERILLDAIAVLDWDKPWGYCIKSIYCHLKGVHGIDFPDLKIRHCMTEAAIKKAITGRPYFSTGNNAVNASMIKVLEELYPEISKYERQFQTGSCNMCAQQV